MPAGIPRIVARAAASLLLSLCATAALAGADWQFRPVLGFNVQYSQNPFGAREAEEAADTGTGSASLGVRLPLSRATRKSTTRLTYSAAIQTYNRFRDLDSLDQAASLGWDTAWSQRSTFSLVYTYSWYTDQGRIEPDEVGDDSPVLVRRARVSRDVLRAALAQQLSRRLDFNIALSGSSISYDGLDAVEDQIEGARTNYQGGETYRASLGLSWNHSAQTVSEYFYSYQRVTENPAERITEDGERVTLAGAEREAHGLNARVRFPAGRGGQLRIQGGVARVGRDENRPESQERTTLLGGVFWDKTYIRGSQLQTGYAHRVGSSYGTGGVSTLHSIFLGYSKPFGPQFSGGVAGNLTRRQSVEQEGPRNERDTLRLNAEVVRSVGRTLGLTAGVRWMRQEADQPGLVIQDVIYRFGLRWYPKGWG